MKLGRFYSGLMNPMYESENMDDYVVATYLVGAKHHEDAIVKATSIAIEQTTGSWADVASETDAFRKTYAGKVFGVYEVPDFVNDMDLEASKVENRYYVMRIGYPVVNFEGGFYIAGLAMKWLRDVMQLAGDFVTMDNIAQNTQRTDGLYVCPAFMGTATPTFNGAAKGIVSGLGITNGPNDIIKATLDSLAYTTKDCVETFKAGLPTELCSVAVDGGVTNSDYIMQLVADMTRLEVVRAKNVEATTLGAAYIAGLACGFWANIQDIEANLPDNRTVFTPKMNQEESDALYSGWQKTVGAALKLTE